MVRLEKAPDGCVWVCSACGKRATDRTRLSGGWDESCYLHAVLCKADSVVIDPNTGFVCKAEAVEVKE